MSNTDLMVARARDILAQAPRHPNAQVILLFTSFGNTYECVVKDTFAPDKSDEDGLLQTLVSRGDTRVERVVCMWSDGCVDLPQHEFRRKLLKINASNTFAEIVLFDGRGYVTRMLGNI